MASLRHHNASKTVIFIFSFSERPVSSKTTETSCNADSCHTRLTSDGPRIPHPPTKCDAVIQDIQQQKNINSFTASTIP